MRTIPHSAQPYQRTPEFSETSVPKGLLRDHSTKADVWGRICVLEGRLEYTIQVEPVETHILTVNREGVVEPGVWHSVKPLGPVRFYVEFLRESEANDRPSKAERPETAHLPVQVRLEGVADHRAVRRIHEDAFGQPSEASLVDALRGAAQPALSLVALVDDAIAGHVFLSGVHIDKQKAERKFAGLAPIGVAPALQKRDIGGALMREAIARAPSFGWSAIFLLGDPAYYSRFGFTFAGPLGLHYESEACDSGFQVLELQDGALENCGGLVHYHAAFSGL